MINMLKKIVSNVILIIFISIVLSSCNTNTVFNQNVTIPDACWYKDNAVAFNVLINDSTKTYNFNLNIRNSTNYRYSNLYVFLITELPNGNVSRDTIECILADNEGRWLGKGWGNLKENDILLKAGLMFPLKGNYKFLLQHAMRVDTLSGINNIGLSIIKE